MSATERYYALKRQERLLFAGLWFWLIVELLISRIYFQPELFHSHEQYMVSLLMDCSIIFGLLLGIILWMLPRKMKKLRKKLEPLTVTPFTLWVFIIGIPYMFRLIAGLF